MEEVRQGEIVKYRLEEGPSAGQWRPAMVIKTWSADCVQLAVFVDASNDGFDDLLIWKTSVNEGLENGHFSRIVSERGVAFGIPGGMYSTAE